MAEMVAGPSDVVVPPARNRQARIAVSAAYAVQGLCFAGVVTQVPAIKERFNLGDLHLSLILLAVPVIAGVGSVLAGVLAPRVGSATVLRVAGFGVCLGLALAGLSPSLAMLYPSVAFFGLAVGAVDATMNMQGVARYGRTILNSFHAWWSVAGIVAALVTSGTGAWHWPLAAATGLVAAVGALVVAVAGPRLVTKNEESTAIAAAPHPSGVAPAIRWWPVVLVGCAVMVMYIGESSVSLWSGVLLKDTLLASAAVVPLGWAAYLGFQLTGRMAADRVVGRFGVVGTVAAGGLIGAVGFGLTVVAQTPMAFSTAGALDPTGSGVVIARVNLFNYAGFVVGSALIGVIGDSVGVRLAFAVPAALALLVIPLAFAFRPAEAFRSAMAADDPARPARAMAAE
jgi:MFS family permease